MRYTTHHVAGSACQEDRLAKAPKAFEDNRSNLSKVSPAPENAGNIMNGKFAYVVNVL